MDEPYPCRFCDRLPQTGNALIGGRKYVKLSCMNCHADSLPCQTIKEAVDDWNRRHGRPMVEQKAA